MSPLKTQRTLSIYGNGLSGKASVTSDCPKRAAVLSMIRLTVRISCFTDDIRAGIVRVVHRQGHAS